ncbi:hypothetical protein PENTCL1PPCAC_28555, partial [Pristionchus entomophagus]
SVGDLGESGGLDDLLDELTQASLAVVVGAVEQLAVVIWILSCSSIASYLLLIEQHLQFDHQSLALLSQFSDLSIAVVQIGQLASEVGDLRLHSSEVLLLVLLLHALTSGLRLQLATKMTLN